MSESEFEGWARRYQAEAAADDYNLVVAGWDRGAAHIQGETDPIQKRHARKSVRDTVELVALVLSYYRLDKREGVERLLHLQTYDPARSEGEYLLLFELGKYRRTQLVVEEFRQIDLADLFAAVQFAHLTCLHPDDSIFTPSEHEEVRQAIVEDVRWDFDEDEVGLYFNEFTTGLQVMFGGPE